MSAVNIIHENDDEREIASQAAYALRESFITAAQSGPVMYVENDTVLLKELNGQRWSHLFEQLKAYL